jgi:eukaryotic-like serine/threonine-protein kinase
MFPDRSASDSQLSNLDGPATLALCKTLGDYGEAGALSHDLMLQAGRYATTRFAGDLDILLAAARMYQLGGELGLARQVLLDAGALAPQEKRTLQQLGEVLSELGLPVTPALAIAEARLATATATATREEKEEPAPAPASGLVPLRPTSGSGQQRAASVSTSSLRSQPRADPRHAEPRRPSGALRLPEGLRTQSGMRPGERISGSTWPVERERISSSAWTGDRVSSSAWTGERERERSGGRPSERPRGGGGGRPSERPRGGESGQMAAVVKLPKPSRIRLLDPHDPARWLDRYELIGEIASGGMATVFLARRDGAGGFQRLVAIKRLHPHLAHQEEFVQMFLDEARLAAAIHHPHVVPILESENGNYVVMEFIEGDTLAGLSDRALARGVTLPRTVAVRILLDALAGLHAAHQLEDGEGRLLGLVHRDCTPQNILVGADGSSRITDFGVARAASRLAITRSQTVKGKVAYLSPEQATAGELDRRSDIFTMGIVLWEALAGRPLFHTDNESTTISRLLSAPIPSVRQFAPDVSPDLDEVCTRALQRSAARRYPSAAAMAEALEAAAQHTIGGAGSPGEVGRCVEMLLGADLAAQRDAVRAWTAQNEPAADSRRRNPASEMPSLRSPAIVDIPRPPLMPHEGLDAAMPPAETPAASPAKPAATPTPPEAARPSQPPASTRPLPKAAPAPAAPEVTAKPTATAPKRRLSTWLTVAAILLVGASSPLWMKRLEQLRDMLLQSDKPPRGAASAAPVAPADPPDK